LEADEAPSPAWTGTKLARRCGSTGVNDELFDGATGAGGPGSLLCGDIRTAQGASIVRRHGRRKVIADNDVRDPIIMVTAGH
jgi:hypothetical protein